MAVSGRSLPFAVTLQGGAMAEPLGAALTAQWTYGFPTVPKPGLQLTHGFMQYPAGMQPLAATHLLEALPDGVVLDPFMGGGTTLIEAMRSGRQAFGADASPLALFTSAHQTWQATDEDLVSLREQATEACQRCEPGFMPAAAAPAEAVGGPKQAEATDGTRQETSRSTKPSGARLDRSGAGKTTWRAWDSLRDEIEGMLADDVAVARSEDEADALCPLWFCFAAAQQRAERYKYANPLASFDATVDSYVEAVRAFRGSIPPQGSPATAAGSGRRGNGAWKGKHATLLLSDARELELSAHGLPLADALITSPPYAGVYDYLSHARQARARLGAQGASPLMGLRGTPDGRDWPAAWRSTREMGARKAMKKAAAGFRDVWNADQEAWLRAARSNLRSGGRAAVMIGDGETGLDALCAHARPPNARPPEPLRRPAALTLAGSILMCAPRRVSTSEAAEAAGLIVLASATIASTTEERTSRTRGRRRPEHALLLEVP